jgi:hypothetical protein
VGAIPSVSRCTGSGTGIGYHTAITTSAWCGRCPCSRLHCRTKKMIIGYPQGMFFLPFFVWKELGEVRRMNKMFVHLNL